VKKAVLGFVLGLLTPAFVFFVAAVLGVFKIEADVSPLRIECRLAAAALNASIRRIPAEQNPYRVDNEFVLDGFKLFESGCAGCHGGYSKRSDWGSKHFYPPAPQFGEAPPRRSEAEIFYVVRHGIRYGGMGGWSDLITKEQTWQVASFLSRLDALPPQVAEEWHKQ
jgi:mono/diheme cytochrome c family protein